MSLLARGTHGGALQRTTVCSIFHRFIYLTNKQLKREMSEPLKAVGWGETKITATAPSYRRVIIDAAVYSLCSHAQTLSVVYFTRDDSKPEIIEFNFKDCRSSADLALAELGHDGVFAKCKARSDVLLEEKMLLPFRVLL